MNASITLPFERQASDCHVTFSRTNKHAYAVEIGVMLTLLMSILLASAEGWGLK
jgi:hypothetical protein